MNARRAVRISKSESGVGDAASADWLRNSVEFASERTDKHAVYKQNIDAKLSGYLAPVRLCGMCLADSQAYSPCSRSHLKKISVSRRHPNRGELWRRDIEYTLW